MPLREAVKESRPFIVSIVLFTFLVQVTEWLQTDRLMTCLLAWVAMTISIAIRLKLQRGRHEDLS